MSGGTRWLPAMRAALAEARAAGEAGDVPIGAVVVAPDGRLLARAGNEREQTGDPTAHAEVLALRRAVEALSVGAGFDSALRAPLNRRSSEEPIPLGERTSEARESKPTWRLEDCTLVVTLEPCAMCAGAIVNARIGRLVFGAFDPKAGAVSSLWDIVRDPRLNHRVEVVTGVASDECGAILHDFFGRRR